MDFDGVDIQQVGSQGRSSEEKITRIHIGVVDLMPGADLKKLSNGSVCSSTGRGRRSGG